MNLCNYDWNGINFIDVFRVKSGEVGSGFFEHGRTDIYQIGLKLSGETKIIYDRQTYKFKEASILYLPKEKTDDIEYKKTILEQGESLCIFFDT